MGNYNLARLLESQARDDRGGLPFLQWLEGGALARSSLAEFLAQVRTWAALLRSRGVGTGDRVVFITTKSPNQHRLFYACWWLGAIAVPVCETLGDMETGFIIRDCEPKLIVVQDELWDKVGNAAADLPMARFSEFPLRPGAQPLAELAEVDDDAVAALVYTSGSTGMPKGVMLSHKNLCRNAQSALQVFEFGKDDNLTSLLPYWHCFGLLVEVVIPVMSAAAVTVPQSQKEFKQGIQTIRPTVMLVVPRIIAMMQSGIEKKIADRGGRVKELFDRAVYNASRIFTAGARLDGGLFRMAAHHVFYDPLIFRKIRQNFGGRLRFIVSGGAPLDMEHQIFFKYLGIPVYQGYGLTETSPVISANHEGSSTVGNCGPVLPWLTPEQGGDWMIKDEDGALGKTGRGELLVRGDCVMKGYWRHKDESAKTMADGWLHTGDGAYMDEDGCLHIEGRQGNMIVLVGGEKLHPEHVEEVVKGAPLVSEAMVFGEGCKNVYAFVNVDEEKARGIPPADLQKQVRAQVLERVQHLALFQRPKEVLILPAFNQEDGTITPTLKIRRYRIREKYAEAIRKFLAECGEEYAVKGRGEVGIHSSRVLESLKK